MKDSIKEMIQLMNGNVNLVHALGSKWGEGIWSYSGKDSDYSGLKWLSENIEKPSQSEIEEEIERLQAEFDAQQYQRNRVSGVSGSYAASQGTGSRYPAVTDQLDMLFHELETSGSLTTSGSWYKTITSVKDANPKPE